MKNVESTSDAGIDTGFWYNKKVLITGHTGFKGTWLSFWLSQMGAVVKGISLKPHTDPNMYDAVIEKNDLESVHGNIQDLEFLKKEIKKFNPEIIFHLAAQTIVRDSYQNPIETFKTNIMGTANILEAVKLVDSIKAILCVTSDKCYENHEWPWKYRENDEMGGWDPYSASKGCSELVIRSYRRSFFNKKEFEEHEVAIASARAGNVIGGGDWACDRLIPDIVRSFNHGEPVVIRNPEAVRPWQHVLDVLRGYIILTQNLYNNGDQYSEAWNFGPDTGDSRTVRDIVERMVAIWGDGATWKHEKNDDLHEAFTLKLDSSKAQSRLGWKPILSIDQGLEFVVDWYKSSYKGHEKIRTVTEKQISEFSKKCKGVLQTVFLNFIHFLEFI